MLEGRFGNTSGRPYLAGRLVLPRLKRQGDISFLVDTGADRSVVMQVDGTRLGIDYAALPDSCVNYGIGGLSEDFTEPALLIFSEPGRNLYVYSLQIIIFSPSPDTGHFPSLLGRDILDQWRMTYDKSNASLKFKVLTADQTISLQKGNK